MSEELRRGILKGRVIGYYESTPEERKRDVEEFEAFLRAEGILKEGEHMQEVDVDKL